MYNLIQGHAALRRGRVSIDEAAYFLTICVDRQQKGLKTDALICAIIYEAKKSSCGWTLRTMVVMPDHIHLLVRLTPGASLSTAVRLFKGRTAAVLRATGLKWQKGYYDHRLRSEEPVKPVFDYIFLNPFRAGLIEPGQHWAEYYCDSGEWEWFGPQTDQASAFPEWLK